MCGVGWPSLMFLYALILFAVAFVKEEMRSLITLEVLELIFFEEALRS